MRKSGTKRGLFAIIVMALLLMIAAPATSLAQGRSRNRYRDNNYWSSDRKCRKFVNCHDARDGRWDGRGARGDRVGYVFWRNRNRNRVNNRTQNLWWQRRAWVRRHRNDR